MKNKRTLILDSRCVSRCLDMKQAIREVERAFSLFGKNKTVMPSKIYLDLKQYDGDFRAMPAYVEGMGAALKWVNVHPRNRQKGLPTVMATIILSDPKTGYPLAIMDGTQITNYRTGAAGGVAAKYLARSNSSTIALIGCGEQAFTQLLAIENNFNIKLVKVWGFKAGHVKKFLKSISKKKYEINASKAVKECTEGADIVISTTPSRKPIIKFDWLKPGAHINAIGADAPGKHELEFSLLKRSRLVIDNWQQASHSGEINVALRKKAISKKHIDAELPDIVNKRVKGRTDKKQITVFDSTGLAVQDAALAYAVFKEAKRKKLGKRINFAGS